MRGPINQFSAALKRKVSPALVLSLLALFFAISTGGAVALEGTNDVSGDDIQSGAVTSSDIKNDTIQSEDIKGDEVKASDIAPDSVKSGQIDENAVKGNKIDGDTIKSSDIDNGAVKSADVENNSLTGEDIDEESLSLLGGGQAGGGNIVLGQFIDASPDQNGTLLPLPGIGTINYDCNGVGLGTVTFTNTAAADANIGSVGEVSTQTVEPAGTSNPFGDGDQAIVLLINRATSNYANVTVLMNSGCRFQSQAFTTG